MPNKRMTELGEKRSVIRDLFEYGCERKKIVGADKVYDFSIGNPSIPSPPAVNEALIELIRETEPTSLHGYSSAAGDPAVRKAVAENINARFGQHLTANEIYMTCGAAASLTISLNALLDPGDEVIVFAPFFPEYAVFIEKAGGKLVSVRAAGQDFAPDLEELREKITEKTRAVIVNSPNNPSGAVIGRECLKSICAILEEKSEVYGAPIFIIADEPYRELVYGGVEVPYIMNEYRNTLVCYSYSKSLSLPGERIGYIAVCPDAEGKDKLFAAVCGAGRALGFVCAPVLFQKMLLTCIGEKTNVYAYEQNRNALYEALTGMGYTCVQPQGAFYLFIEAPGGDDNAFCEKAKKHDLLLVPSSSFGLPGYMRIAYCVAPETIKNALPAFRALAAECGL